MGRSARAVFGLLAILGLSASLSCNRAAIRIRNAPGSFPEPRTDYFARSSSPRAVRIDLPVDVRVDHHGERVAGTRWTACSTDPFVDTSAAHVLQSEVEREVRRSGIFRLPGERTGWEPLVLETEIRAMCAQAIGFIYLRVAGITALRFTLRDGDEVVFDRTIERVVTDADPEYTGGSIGFIEEIMKVVISDSLREVFLELLPALDEIETR